ncbi:MAG: tetratricopeptide repeat protein [Okeania sp. SIO3B5]|uniref:tetratricopeptide repeat protein n=1 Tax=Okeania sp. SIO3B5 TaxID=2607811 RepID=UPI0014014103|nr:tetratricopeptide repeat protein [Okeania sp. SIO3B5]NEO52824.1 tetratricopeptide repeat protein [Okeania sp. SIO3B5]
MDSSHLETAVNTYKQVLQELKASQPPKPEQVLAVLNARDVVQTAWNQSTSISANSQQQLLQLDNLLREQAHRITQTKGVNLSQYRSSFSPPEKAWWWRLETEVPPHFWDRLDWLWRGLTVAGWTANLGLLMDIVPRFIGAGTGLLGTIAVAFPSLIALLQAKSELTQTGKEGFNRLLKRLRIPEHFHEEARLGSTTMLLLLLVALRANFPAFSDFYNRKGLEKYQKGEFAGAESAYQQALAIDPDNFKANYNLGVLYEDLQQFDKAKTQYQLAVKANFIKAQNNQARLHILEGKPDLAIPLLWSGLGNLGNEDNPSLRVTYSLYKNLGWAFWKEEATEQAEEFLRLAIQIGESENIQNRGSAHCLLAQLLEGQQEKQAEAVEQWQQCCKFGSVSNPDETQWLISAHKKLKEEGKSCDGEISNL